MNLTTAAELGVCVRQVRRAHDLTQAQLAGLAGTGVRFVSELERGKPNIALDKTLQVLTALGLRLDIVPIQP